MRTFGNVRGRLTYANVIATLALFFALGGGVAVAAPKFIEEGSPAGGDLTGTYPNPSIAANAVTGGKVLNNSLTGDDITESTLGKVPSAAVADSAAIAGDADTLDGINSTGFLGINAKAADSDLLDGLNSSAFLGINAKAADSDQLDGIDSTGFLGATAKAADSDLLDGNDSSAFLGINAKAADSDLLDGKDSSAFALAGSTNTYSKAATTDVSGVSSGGVEVSCDSADHVVGGGYDLGSDAMHALENRPIGPGVNPTGWSARAWNGALSDRVLQVWVLCADVA